MQDVPSGERVGRSRPGEGRLQNLPQATWPGWPCLTARLHLVPHAAAPHAAPEFWAPRVQELSPITRQAAVSAALRVSRMPQEANISRDQCKHLHRMSRVRRCRMNQVDPCCSSAQPGRNEDPQERQSRPRRIRPRHVAFAIGLMAMAMAQFWVTDDRAPREAADLPLTIWSQAGSDDGVTMTAGTPQAGGAATADNTADDRADHHSSVELRAGTELVAPAVFKCRAVRKDESVAAGQYPVPLPPFSKGVFPCTRCHDEPDDFNLTKRNLTLDHTNIKLAHGPREQWCYGCHNPTNRDKLRLAGGRTVSFRNSYELCGQCHGPKLRDWRLGIHGRRTGCWNGEQQYLLCVHCHSPHSPKFRKLKPKPRPKKPSEIRPGRRRAGVER